MHEACHLPVALDLPEQAVNISKVYINILALQKDWYKCKIYILFLAYLNISFMEGLKQIL